MLIKALYFILTASASILTMVFLLRFFMQLFRTPFANPLGLMVISLTDFAVKPARKFIPSWKKMDLSTMILAITTQFLLQLCLFSLHMLNIETKPLWPSLLGLSLLGVFLASLDVFFFAILLQAILSWVNPYTPIAPVLDSLTKPVLKPIRRFIPSANGIDFSSLVALFLIQLLKFSLS